MAIAGEVRKQHGGGALRATGATLLCSFSAADATLEATQGIRDAVRSRVSEAAARRLKMGLHAGVVTFGEAGVSGETVTTVARLVVCARPGQTLLTEDVQQLASPANRRRMGRAAQGESLESRFGTRLYEYSDGAVAGGDAGALPARDRRLETHSMAVPDGLRLTTAFAAAEPAAMGVVGLGDKSPVQRATPEEEGTAGGSVASASSSSLRSKKMIFPHKRVTSVTPPAPVVPDPTPVTAPTESSKIATRNRRVGGESYGTEAADVQKREQAPRLCLIHRNQVVVVDETNRPVVSIGREASNDIVLALETVSRRHAEVSYRGGKFYLTDHSWNGTYLYDADGNETAVHKADAPLASHGMICPGCPAYEAGVEAIQFLPGV